jgi:hypothetical protein
VAHDNDFDNRKAKICCGLGLITTLTMAAYAPGPWCRRPIVLGGILGHVTYQLFAKSFGLGKAITFNGLSQAAQIGLLHFTELPSQSSVPNRPEVNLLPSLLKGVAQCHS